MPAHCVPDSCRIVIDRRFLEEEPNDQVRAEVTGIPEVLQPGRPNFRYDLRELNHILPSMTDRDASVAAQIEQVLGTPAQFVASPGTYDQKHIDRIGKLKNCVPYGPGILELAHKPDE